MSENHKEIEVVSGDGSNLDISPVYEHLNATKPKMKSENPKNIVIPKSCISRNSKKEKDNKKSESTSENE